jgi:hypothetical protein
MAIPDQIVSRLDPGIVRIEECYRFGLTVAAEEEVQFVLLGGGHPSAADGDGELARSSDGEAVDRTFDHEERVALRFLGAPEEHQTAHLIGVLVERRVLVLRTSGEVPRDYGLDAACGVEVGYRRGASVRGGSEEVSLTKFLADPPALPPLDEFGVVVEFL